MNRALIRIVAIVCFLSFCREAEAGFKIYYIRHGQAGHNVVRDWQWIPKDQWPAYVGNENMFTPKGETQVAAVPDKLAKYHFDFIAVSPMWRTRNTVLPYLKANGLQAEIWPELHECRFPLQIDSATLPAPNTAILKSGAKIKIPAGESAFFRLRKDGLREFGEPAKLEPQFSADIRMILQSLLDQLLKQFGGSEKSVLLVGHGNNGCALLKLLAGKDLPEGYRGLDNTQVWMAEQQADGSFKIEILNDKPYAKAQK